MGKGIMSHGIMVRIFVLALVLFCGGAESRLVAAEQELPCAEEIAKYCKEVKPGGGRILDCLNDHQAELSVSCRSKLEEAKKKLMEARQACTGDMEKFCGDVKPGEGRIVKCLRDHAHELSAACKKVIAQPVEKGQAEKETQR